MPRLARGCLTGGLHHVINRGNHRQTLFHGPEEFAQFIELMAEGQRRHGIDLWGYCLMSNHWHVVVEVSRVEKLSLEMYLSPLTVPFNPAIGLISAQTKSNFGGNIASWPIHEKRSLVHLDCLFYYRRHRLGTVDSRQTGDALPGSAFQGFGSF